MHIKLLTGAAMALGLAAVASSASATSYVVDWSFTGPSAVAGGELFLDSTATPDVFSLTGINGFENLNNAGPVAINGVSGYAGADNDIYQDAPFVDFAGFSFTTAGVGAFNIYLQNPGVFELSSVENPGGAPDNLHPGVLTVTHGDNLPGVTGGVPEPSAWALMIVGFGGAGAMLRSKRRKATLVTG